MNVFDAWHLPGLDARELTFATYRLGELQLRAPMLTGDQMMVVLQHLRDARARRLATMSTADIVTAINACAVRLADAKSEESQQARTLLAAATGYSAPVIDDILHHMTHDWQRASLQKLLQIELPDPRVLDEPIRAPKAERLEFARGPALAYQVFSGNVPGVAVTAMIRCMLVKSAQFGKTASGEPVLPVLFARMIATLDPALAACIAVAYWPGGTTDGESTVLREADTVIVYGGEAAVQAMRERVRAATRLLVHGPKLSFGIVGRAAHIDVAEDIAYAVAAYDQQGCVSPHIVFVEQGGRVQPKRLARAVSDALAKLALAYPRRRLDPAEAMAIRAARATIELRDTQGDESEVYGPDDISYTVLYDEDASFRASCLNRTVYIKPVERAEAISQLLQPHRGIMQSAALAGFSANQARSLALMLADCGVTRIASFKTLPWPPMWWHHDGRGVLRELLAWHDMEST